jgi:hypothetical protein
LRSNHRVTKQREAKTKHLSLYRIVEKHGGPPRQRKGTVAFWRRVMDEYNKDNPLEGRYTTWKGVKRAYGLLMNRLEIKEVKTKTGAHILL